MLHAELFLQDSILTFLKEKKMRKFNVMILVSLLTIAFAAAIVMAGVTELKVYTSENTQVFARPAPGEPYAPSPTGRGPRMGMPVGEGPQINEILQRIFFHHEIHVTTDAAVGPYAFGIHFPPAGDKFCEMIMYDDYLDVSSTERITFWVKSESHNLPLWMFIANPKDTAGVDIESPSIMIDGETIVRQDPFGFHEVNADISWSGEWQFVSIPLTYMHLTVDDMVISDSTHSLGGLPWSWSGDRFWEGRLDMHRGAPYFDETKIRHIKFQDKDGTEVGVGDDRIGHPAQASYPWPAGRNPDDAFYFFDEIVFTLNEGTGVTGVDGNQTVMPLTYELNNNYPNPFNPSTIISYGLPVSNQVLIDVYNTLGQKVRTLVDRYVTKGTYQTTWDATDDYGNVVPSGVYFYKMQASHFISVKKMILLR
jgi:hypothetical protein